MERIQVSPGTMRFLEMFSVILSDDISEVAQSYL